MYKVRGAPHKYTEIMTQIFTNDRLHFNNVQKKLKN